MNLASILKFLKYCLYSAYILVTGFFTLRKILIARITKKGGENCLPEWYSLATRV
jgi:hypothetical protein